ncbi:hypothetical protein [Streptosporangium sandarakinum]
MTRHRITIAPNTPAPGTHQVVVDGQDISDAVNSLTLRVEGGVLPVVDVELAMVEVTRIDSEDAELYIPLTTRDALIALGWTPPPASSTTQAATPEEAL